LTTTHLCHIKITTSLPLSHQYPRELVTIGDHIRARRLDLKLLQKDVAKIIGVSENVIGLWELNQSSPMQKYLPLIDKFLGYIPDVPAGIQGWSKKLLEYRKKHKLSKRRLAMLINIHEYTLVRIETGKRIFSIDSIKKITTFLNSIDE
jgi:transcriptional regulator with XRE-family HTH domain